MSVYGYGQSYEPASRQSYSAQMDPTLTMPQPQSGRGSFGGGMPSGMPGSQPAPMPMPMDPRGTPTGARDSFAMGGVTTAPGMDWSPVADDPWKSSWTTRKVQRGTVNDPYAAAAGAMLGLGTPIGGAIGGYLGGLFGKKPKYDIVKTLNPFEKNVIGDNFNGANSFLGEENSKQIAMGKGGTDQYARDVAAANPTTANQLYDQVNNLNQNQLLAVDTKGSWYDQFQGAAKDNANAFANKDYTEMMRRSGWTQQNTTDWLQAAYNQMLDKMNGAWLL